MAENQDIYPILDVGTFSGSASISPGRRIRVKMGSDIPMTIYGVDAADRVAGNQDWGWEGTVPDVVTLNAILESGDHLRLQVTLSGVAGFQDVSSVIVPVVEG